MKLKRGLIFCFLFLLPWKLRRYLMIRLFKYDIHPTAYIGYSFIFAAKLTLKEGARIKSLNFINNLDHCILNEFSQIDIMNWITGLNSSSKINFQYTPERKCELVLGVHTRITNRHFIDCNGGVYIGDFTTFAGIRSVILTHSIDVRVSRQTAGPVHIGKYCFIGTNCILLKGCAIPDYSVLGAGAVVTKNFKDTHSLYAGNPARHIKKFEQEEFLYFKRPHGNVS